MSTKQTELQSLVAEWIELPTPGSGYWFLHIAVTHGSGKVIEDWLTQYQAEEVVIVAEQKPWRAQQASPPDAKAGAGPTSPSAGTIERDALAHDIARLVSENHYGTGEAFLEHRENLYWTVVRMVKATIPAARFAARAVEEGKKVIASSR